MRNNLAVLSFAALLSFGSVSHAQNLILNGSFEDTTAVGCAFNNSNTTFNSLMANCTGFGTALGGAGEICIMEGSDCGWGSFAQDGQVKLGIAVEGVSANVDEFSMDLSTPIMAGTTYTLEFYAQAIIESFSPDIGNVEVGISNSATSFGTQIFSGTPSSGAWTMFSHTFTAPVGGAFLTVRQQAFTDSWNHIDNFSLEGGGFSLDITGTCGASMTATVSGATPSGSVAIAYSFGQGSFVIPAGFACAGTTTGLSGVGTTLFTVLSADAAGSASVSGNVPPSACGAVSVQAVDISTCAVSNVVDL